MKRYRVTYKVGERSREAIEKAHNRNSIKARYKGLEIVAISDFDSEERERKIREKEEQKLAKIALAAERIRVRKSVSLIDLSKERADSLTMRPPKAGHLPFLRPMLFVQYLRSQCAKLDTANTEAGNNLYPNNGVVSRFLKTFEVIHPIVYRNVVRYLENNEWHEMPTPPWVIEFLYGRESDMEFFENQPTFARCLKRMARYDFQCELACEAQRSIKKSEVRQ